MEPDLYSLLDWKPLSDTRNDDFATVIGCHIFKFGILRQKNEFLLFDTFPKFRVSNAALTENDNMLDIITFRAKPMVERKRKILIQQDLQDACSTAGGK